MAEEGAQVFARFQSLEEGFFRQIFDVSAQPILVLNKSQEIILLNASASALLESEPDSLIGEVSLLMGIQRTVS